ncbi:tetratricopeptide repeat protein [Methanosarcina sp. DH1]|nr:tetratricopeptide repeat protein [Methanosarcina sp. DH1]
MSESLRDSAGRHFQKTLSLMQEGKLEEALKELEQAEETAKLLLKDPENEFFQADLQTSFYNVFTLGYRFYDMGRFPQAQNFYELSLLISQNLLATDPENVSYQSYVGTTLNNLGALLSNMGRIEEAKQKYEKALEIYENLLENDLKNVSYQSDVSMTLNNLGNLLSDMGRIEEAKQRYENALEMRRNLLENDLKNVSYQSSVAVTLNNLGNLLSNMGRIEEAKQRYENALEMRQNLLENDLKNVSYQSDVSMTLNNLGNLLSYMGRIEEAKQRYEKALKIYENLLATDSDNVSYQSYVGGTLNNLGTLLSDMGRIEEAKQRYEESLAIYTEPMQYLTIGKKSNSIIRLIDLNSILATEEKEPLDRMRYLKEVYKLCKNNQEFFIKYELRNERELVIEAGLNAYIDFLMKRMKLENGFEKRAEKYGKAFDAVKKLEELEKDEVISRLYISAACYLEGRKYINEAFASGKTELGLVSEAVKKFKEASQNYKKADVCYNVYSGLLNILEYVEGDGEVKVHELEKVVAEAFKPFQDDANLSGIKASLESIPKIFQEKSRTTRRQRQEEFEERISLIESKALENLFRHVNRKIKDYFEKPLNLNIIYEKWILKVRFLDPEQIKGKLTIKIGDKILFDRALSRDETEKGLLEINLRELGYLPQGEDKISFMPTGQKKPVFETVNYFEKITNGHEIRILQYDCSNQICIGKEPKIAVVQLKYHAYKENSVIKISTDDNYHKKVIAILEALKNEADIIVFPEFSIPFDYLEEMQKFADENGILVVAGSHYVVDENLEKYGKLFTREFEEADLLKNISPVVIPSSKIVHNEKYLGARIERSVFSEEGMEPGKVNHIFRLQEKLNIGVMICYEFLDTELRHRLIPVCNIILVPQTNDNPQSFYETASTDINRPLEGGNTAFVMANGIFTVEAEENVLGGSAGIALTLDKHSNAQKEKGIISPVNGAMEQLILLATINTGYFPAWDSQIGQVPITTKIIHIFEESEILKDPEGDGKEFIQFLKEIDSCKNSSELKELLEKNRRDLNQKENEGKEKKSLIEQYSPLMNKQIQDLKNHNLEKLKKKCSFILIPAI